jgi:heterodisulfide reductase subunit A-like polyferredoxin
VIGSRTPIAGESRGTGTQLLMAPVERVLDTTTPTTSTLMSNQVIVVGGGLAGLSAAHTLLERGASVLLLDKQG